MADFNVKVKNAENSSGFVGASRGSTPVAARPFVQEVSSSAASGQANAELLGNVGVFLKTAVDTTDELIKRDINERSTQLTDQVFDEFGVSDASLFGRDVNQEPTPDEITRAEENLKRLTNANKRGGISDQAYAVRMESISRQLRARYPGHRDYIDQRISSISGIKPANSIVRNLIEQAQQEAGAISDAEKRRLAYIEELNAAGVEFEGKYTAPYEELLRQAGPRMAALKQVERQKQQIELAKSQNEAIGDLQLRAARSVVNAQMVDTMSNVMSPFGKQYSEILTTIKQSAADGRELTAEQVSAIRTQFANLQSDFVLKAQEGILSQFGNDLTEKQRQEAIAPAIETFKMMENSLINKDYGLFNRMANKLEAMRTEDSVKLLSGPEEVRAVSTMNRELGPQATTIMLQASERLNNAFLRTLVDDGIVNMFGKGRALKEEHEKLKSAGVSDPAAYAALLNAPLSVLNDPSSKPEALKSAARTLFSEDNAGYLSKIDSAERGRVFARMVNPTTYELIKRSGDQEMVDNYKGWARNAYASYFRTQGNTLKEILTNNEDIVVFNKDSIAFQINPKYDGNLGLSGKTSNPVLERVNYARSVINDANLVLKGMAPMLKDDTRDPVEFVSTALGGLQLKVLQDGKSPAAPISKLDLSSIEQIINKIERENFKPQSGRESTNVDDRRGQMFTKGLIDEYDAYLSFYNEAVDTYKNNVEPGEYDRFRTQFDRAAKRYARKAAGLPPIPEEPLANPLQRSLNSLDEALSELDIQKVSK